PMEDVVGYAQPACVVSYNFWKNTLGARDDALGTQLLIGDVKYTVVGVAPDGFNGIGLNVVDVWLPLHVAAPEFQGHEPELWSTDHSAWMDVIGRLKPGVSVNTASAELATIYREAGERTRDKKMQGTYLLDPLQPGRSSIGNKSAKIALWLGAG